jgi:hypothetical protein
MTSILDPANPRVTRLYTFDNVSGTTIIDETGTHNAVNTGAVFVTGILGNAVKADNATDKVDVGLLDYRGQKAISVFVSSPGGGTILQNGRNGVSYPAIQLFNGLLQMNRYNSVQSGASTRILDLTYPAPVNQPYSLIIQIDEPVVSIYVNNELAAQGACSYPIAASNYTSGFFDISGHSSSANVGLLLEQFRFIEGVLTAAERQELAEEPWPYEVKGLVNVDGTPLSTQVRLYNAASGELLHTLNTDANGAYQKVLSSADPIYAMAIEPNGYRPLVHGPINPALRNPS